ncbi:hypothetical protein KI387_038975, partial [Taxus chinensis]
HSDTNLTSRNSRNERSNKGRRRRAAAEQRRIEQQRWGQYITDGEEDSAPVVPAIAPRSSNRRRARRNHRNNSTLHLEEDDYYEDELAFHAARPRNEICDDLELEMALSLSLSLADPTSHLRNNDHNGQSIVNMSYEGLNVFKALSYSLLSLIIITKNVIIMALWRLLFSWKVSNVWLLNQCC